MNPRVSFNLLLGWCPGVKAAAKFIPDREVSNKRIAFSLALVVTVAVTTYALSNVVLTWSGIPNVNLMRSFSNPVLGTRNGNTYLLFGQETESGSSAYTGPGYLQLGVYFGELMNNGTLTNVANIANVEHGAGISQSLLLTGDHTWKIAHSYYLLYSLSQSGYSPLYLAESLDGLVWSHPTIAYGEPTQTVTPTLLELSDGSQFLLFRSNQTWMYAIGDKGVWSKPAPAPFSIEKGAEGEFLYESAFIDALGRVNVVWDEGSYDGADLGLRYSTFINGSWSEPKTLTSNSVSLNGQQPRIFYSNLRSGYYLSVTSLQQTGSPEWHPITMLYFSKDWVNWELLSYFDTWGYSLVELEDGSFARVIMGHGGHTLSYSWSTDGVNWSSEVPVAMIVDEESTSSETAYQRSNFSYAISIIISLATLLALTRVTIIG